MKRRDNDYDCTRKRQRPCVRVYRWCCGVCTEILAWIYNKFFFFWLFHYYPLVRSVCKRERERDSVIRRSFGDVSLVCVCASERRVLSDARARWWWWMCVQRGNCKLLVPDCRRAAVATAALLLDGRGCSCWKGGWLTGSGQTFGPAV